MTTLPTLLSRIEDGSGPDMDLDQDLYDLLWLGLEQAREIPLPHCPRFTASLDACIALCERVLPGWVWKLSTDADASAPPGTTAHAMVASETWADPGAGIGNVAYGHALTPACALLAAVVKARMSENE